MALPEGRDRSSYAYAVLLSLGVLDAAAYSIIAPVAPAIAERTGTGPGLIGALVASFPVGIVLGFVLAGIGVRRGRYLAVLLLSLGLLAVGSIGFALADSLPGYFAARVVMGLGSGGLWMGVTFSTLDRWPGQEYLCMSRIFAAYSVGGLVGPALGAIGGVRDPFLAYFALVCLAALLVPGMGRSRHRRVFDSDRSVLRLPAFRVASAGILFATLALGLIEGVLPLHLARQLTQMQIGVLYAGVSLVVAVAAATASRYGPRGVMLAGAALAVIGISATGIATAAPFWIVGLAVAGVGVGIANTGSIGILLHGVPTDRSVTAIIVWSQIGIAGYLIGPAVGGTVAEALGFGMVGGVLLLGAVPVALLASARTPANSA
jgi:MFS family permease